MAPRPQRAGRASVERRNTWPVIPAHGSGAVLAHPARNAAREPGRARLVYGVRLSVEGRPHRRHRAHRARPRPATSRRTRSSCADTRTSHFGPRISSARRPMPTMLSRTRSSRRTPHCRGFGPVRRSDRGSCASSPTRPATGVARPDGERASRCAAAAVEATPPVVPGPEVSTIAAETKSELLAAIRTLRDDDREISAPGSSSISAKRRQPRRSVCHEAP